MIEGSLDKSVLFVDHPHEKLARDELISVQHRRYFSIRR